MTCQQELRYAGKAYPRTCQDCGFGRCKKFAEAEQPSVAPYANGWMPIETAPRDGSKIWGNDGDDAIAMFWHEGFNEFVSSFRRMEMATGYTINGKPYEDHHPVVHKPTHWKRPSPPQEHLPFVKQEDGQ